MLRMDIAPEVMAFYASTIDESQRLTMSADGALELLRTQELLRRYLPPASWMSVAAPVRMPGG